MGSGAAPIPPRPDRSGAAPVSRIRLILFGVLALFAAGIAVGEALRTGATRSDAQAATVVHPENSAARRRQEVAATPVVLRSSPPRPAAATSRSSKALSAGLS